MIDFMQYLPSVVQLSVFFNEICWGGGGVSLVYGSLFSSYMAFMCFYSDD